VLLVVLVLLVITLGATGYSDRILDALIGEELRGLRTSLAETIRDPDAVEAALGARRTELEASYGLDVPWWQRLPGMVARVLTFDLGEARTVRSFEGSNHVADIVLERLPNTILLLTTSLVITAAIGLSIGVWLSTRVGSRIDQWSPTWRPSQWAAGLVGRHPADHHLLLLAARPAVGRHVLDPTAHGSAGTLPGHAVARPAAHPHARAGQRGSVDLRGAHDDPECGARRPRHRRPREGHARRRDRATAHPARGRATHRHRPHPGPRRNAGRRDPIETVFSWQA
jgi:hypothetical protein